jgi:dihydropyrimidinase
VDTYDLIVKNADIATSGDRYRADIGIRAGRIVAIARELSGEAAEVIDALGRLVTPGGVDGHVHLDQPTSDGAVFSDDFFTGTRSAACGGTTTVIPFAAQQKGHSLQVAVIDYAFHLIVSEPPTRSRAKTCPGSSARATPRSRST